MSITDDRLDILEALVTDLFRQLRNARQNISDRQRESDTRLHQLATDISKLGELAYLPSGSLASTLAQLTERIKDLETVIGKHEDDIKMIGEAQRDHNQHTRKRMAATEQAIANLEDAFTQNPNHITGCVCAQCRRKAGPAIGTTNYGRRSLGWINIYRNRIIVWHESKATADEESATGRVACIEVFDGDGLN
jgi:hypothetical protein